MSQKLNLFMCLYTMGLIGILLAGILMLPMFFIKTWTTTLRSFRISDEALIEGLSTIYFRSTTILKTWAPGLESTLSKQK